MLDSNSGWRIVITKLFPSKMISFPPELELQKDLLPVWKWRHQCSLYWYGSGRGLNKCSSLKLKLIIYKYHIWKYWFGWMWNISLWYKTLFLKHTNLLPQNTQNICWTFVKSPEQFSDSPDHLTHIVLIRQSCHLKNQGC